MLIFLSYSGPSGILGSDGKQNTAFKPVLEGVRFLHFPLVLMNRLNKTESAVFLYSRFSLFLKDPFFQIIECIRKGIQNVNDF